MLVVPVLGAAPPHVTHRTYPCTLLWSPGSLPASQHLLEPSLLQGDPHQGHSFSPTQNLLLCSLLHPLLATRKLHEGGGHVCLVPWALMESDSVSGQRAHVKGLNQGRVALITLWALCQAQHAHLRAYPSSPASASRVALLAAQDHPGGSHWPAAFSFLLGLGSLTWVWGPVTHFLPSLALGRHWYSSHIQTEMSAAGSPLSGKS